MPGRTEHPQRHPLPAAMPRPRVVPVRFLCLLLATVACAPDAEGPGPFELTEERAWRAVNRSHTGDDGIFVQATFRTFGYEIARIYSEAEVDDLSQQQVTSRLREFVYAHIDARYPIEDGTDINNLYFQYLIYVNPDFDPTNPIQKAQFDTWRAEYVRRLLGIVNDRMFPMLRPVYDERWGYSLYSRLVFTIYVDGEESDAHPYIADLGERRLRLAADDRLGHEHMVQHTPQRVLRVVVRRGVLHRFADRDPQASRTIRVLLEKSPPGIRFRAR